MYEEKRKQENRKYIKNKKMINGVKSAVEHILISYSCNELNDVYVQFFFFKFSASQKYKYEAI